MEAVADVLVALLAGPGVVVVAVDGVRAVDVAAGAELVLNPTAEVVATPEIVRY